MDLAIGQTFIDQQARRFIYSEFGEHPHNQHTPAKKPSLRERARLSLDHLRCRFASPQECCDSCGDGSAALAFS